MWKSPVRRHVLLIRYRYGNYLWRTRYKWECANTVIRTALSSAIRRVIWWVFTGNRGGPNRTRLIVSLKERPMNANQLAETLHMDYKTVRHHLSVLLKNRLIVGEGEGYGTMYFISPELEQAYDEFMEIWSRLHQEWISRELSLRIPSTRPWIELHAGRCHRGCNAWVGER